MIFEHEILSLFDPDAQDYEGELLIARIEVVFK